MARSLLPFTSQSTPLKRILWGVDGMVRTVSCLSVGLFSVGSSLLRSSRGFL